MIIRREHADNNWDFHNSKCVIGSPIEILSGDAKTGTDVTNERTEAELCVTGEGKSGAEEQPL